MAFSITELEDKKYKDFIEYPEGILTEGKEMDLVKTRGIARVCEPMVNGQNKESIRGILELDKGGVDFDSGKFIELYAELKPEKGLYEAIRYLKLSSESNKQIQVKGLLNKSDNTIYMHSLKLGNLEEVFLEG